MGKEAMLDIERMLKHYPLLQEMILQKPILWSNPDYVAAPDLAENGLNEGLINEARDRFVRFRPVLKRLFKETSGFQGAIQSSITDILKMKKKLEIIK